LKQVTLRLDAYDADARRYVAGAQQLADDRGHPEVDPIHLWYELVDRSEAIQAALRGSGVEPTDVLLESELALRRVKASDAKSDAYLSSRFL
jgi:ATP-dependent Clp protease ATP-binding subunit ClpA